MTAYTIIHTHRFGITVHKIISPDENLNLTINRQDDPNIALMALMSQLGDEYEPDQDEMVDIIMDSREDVVRVPSIEELLK